MSDINMIAESLEDDIYKKYPERPNPADEVVNGEFLSKLERTRAKYYSGPLISDGPDIRFPHKKSIKLDRIPNLEAGILVITPYGILDGSCWCYVPYDRMLYINHANDVVRVNNNNYKRVNISIYYLPVDITIEERTDDESGEVFEIKKGAEPRIRDFKRNQLADKYEKNIKQRGLDLDLSDHKSDSISNNDGIDPNDIASRIKDIDWD